MPNNTQPDGANVAHKVGNSSLIDTLCRADILKFIAEVENAHFRTEHDSGANDQAMLVWNRVRTELAGLPRLRKTDLPAWCVICEKYHVNPHQRKTA